MENENEFKTKSKKVIDENESELYQGKELLIDIETYLKSGVHIGTKFKSGDMKRYIFKRRADGLIVFNIETIDKRIRMIAKTLASMKPEEILVVGRKLYAHQAVKKFASMIGAKPVVGRFIPGTISNPVARSFTEPKLIILCDPLADAQALKEASESHIPVIALVGSDSLLRNVDIAVPLNNKGRKSLALVFYLLTREVLIERKEIDKNAFTAQIEDFEQQIEETKQKDRRFSSRPTGRRPFNSRRKF
ncbi:MAG: 30S ribosomal protein S2 [Candidatus ainarchaeum sp.]|nr:30S ribosomal protein S2 [Candidatus ainarchaeum sp.]